jgi:glutathione S-transferase
MDMKLYYSQGACSLSPHIVARELGLDIQLEKVNTKSHTYNGGSDYYAVNPKGYVPALEISPGEVLTEGPAIVQYLGDRKPGSGVVPAAGTLERYRQQEMLGYINSEIHKTYSPLFNPAVPEEYKTMAKAKLVDRYRWVDSQLEGKSFLLGDSFSVADAYLFTVTNWAKHVGVDISGFKNLGAFMGRVAARPAVQEAMKAEGLLK